MLVAHSSKRRTGLGKDDLARGPREQRHPQPLLDAEAQGMVHGSVSVGDTPPGYPRPR
ncbi:MAG: hypothetical protein ACXW2D_13140 [Burkholderiaceae bacterium]